MEFSKLVSAKLKDRNLSAVAKQLGMPPSVLHDWVKGRRAPSLRQIRYLAALAAYLNLSLEQLFGLSYERSNVGSFLFKDGAVEFEIKIEKVNKK